MKLIEAAAGYAGGTPEGWAAVVNAVAQRLASTVYENPDGHSVSVRDVLVDPVVVRLLEPAVVSEVARARSDVAALGRTVALVMETLDEIVFENPLVDDGTVDIRFTPEKGPVRIVDEDPHTQEIAALRGFHQFEMVPLEFYRDNLEEIVRGALSVHDVSGYPDSPVVVLPAIDPAVIRSVLADPELLRTLDWRLFERLLAETLERLGFSVELQRGTKDGGIDLFAVRSDPEMGSHRYLLQAKRWKKKVGVEPVRQLAFLHQHMRATKSILATTATFTRGAWALGGQYRWQLELKDFRGVRDWVAAAFPSR
jgi:hypothetical protein